MWPNNVTASENAWINATTTTGNTYTYTYRPSAWRDGGGYAIEYDPEQYYEISPEMLSRIVSSPVQPLSGFAEICIDSEISVEQEPELCTDEELEEFLAGE